MKQIIAQGKFTEYINDDGWEYIARKNNRKVVSIIAYTDNNELILVKQFRKPINKYVIEFPAGIIDEGETPQQAALRELKEETGFNGIVRNVEGPFTKSAGITNEETYIVYITALNQTQQNLQDDEKIEIIKVGLDTSDNPCKLLNKNIILDSNVAMIVSVLDSK